MELYNDRISIKGRDLLNEGSLELQKGKITLLQGPNGSGKTSLIRNLSLNSRNKVFRFCVMDQDNQNIILKLDVLHNIAMSECKEKLDKVEQEVKKLGFGKLLERKVKTLSGGESRIVGVLRCLFCDADVLILDEPTNDLDYERVQQLIELLLVAKKTKAILVISHDDRLETISDSILQISNKEILPKGNSSKSEKSAEHGGQQYRNDKEHLVFSKKAMSTNFVTPLVAIAFMIILALQFLIYISSIEEEKPLIPKNQINMYSIASELKSIENEHLLPAFSIESMTTLNLGTQIRMISKLEKFWNSDTYELYELPLKSSEEYTVYPMEFYDIDSDQIIIVMEKYKENVETENSDIDIYVTTDAYYWNPMDILYGNVSSEQRIEMNLDVYNHCVEELESQENLILVSAAVVVKDGYSCDAFFHSEEMEELSKHLVLMTSSEIANHNQKLDELQAIISALEMLLPAALATLVCGINALSMRFRVSKRMIRVLRDYGIEQSIVKQAMKEKGNNRVYLCFLLVGYFVWSCVVLQNVPWRQASCAFALIFMLYLSILWSLGNVLDNYYIKKTYRWNDR